MVFIHKISNQHFIDIQEFNDSQFSKNIGCRLSMQLFEYFFLLYHHFCKLVAYVAIQMWLQYDKQENIKEK